MAKIRRARAKKRLIVDIGASAVRVGELSQTKTGFQLTKYLQKDLPIEPGMEEEQKRELRTNALKEAIKEAKIRHKKVVFGVQGQSVFTRNRALPPVPEFKVTQIVRYEIQQQIPFSLDQIALDYQVLNRTEAGGYEVMMAAIKVDVVEKQLEIIKAIKRNIDVVDVCPLAAYNWLKHTGEFGEEGECVALVDLGAATTDIVIERDNQFRFTRSLNIGGNAITSAIAEGFNMSFLDAEKLKRERGFAPTGDPQRDGKGGEVIGNVLGRLVNEINRSFAYFRSQTGGATVNRVIVTGGGACLRNIIPYLQRQLGIEVKIAQPLAGLAIAPAAQQANDHPEQSAVLLGLALRCVDSVPLEINLIPPRILETARRREQTFYWVLSFVTLGLIMASIIPISAAKDDQVRKRIERLERVVAAYDPTLVQNPSMPSEYETELEDAKAELNRFEKVLNNLDDARRYRQFWLAAWDAVNNARPRGRGVWINSIESTVIGGPGNTGPAARNNKNKKSEDATAAADVEAPAEKKQPAAKKGGEGGLNLSALNFTGGGGGGGGPLAGGGKAAAFSSSGFLGIAPRGIAASSGGGGGALLGGGFSLGGGPSRSPQPAKKASAGPSVVEPNGLVVTGYAESLEALDDFKVKLEESPHFIDGGVYFHKRLVNDVPMSELYQTDFNLAGPVNNKGNISSSGRNSSSGGGGGMNLDGLSLGAAAAPATSSRSVQPGYNEPEIYSFRFDLQFLGDPVPPPD